jgi:hypothetical protein
MNLLFISLRDVNLKYSGGWKCTNRNYLSFCEILGTENVDVLDVSLFIKKNIFSSYLNLINNCFGFYSGLSQRAINIIIKKAFKYDIVFIDVSYLGVISYYLKKAKYKGRIICFFHNVEVNIMRQLAKIRPFSFWRIFPIYYNEKKAIQFSDKIIVLNKRDRDSLISIYNAQNIEIIPISLLDELMHINSELTKVPSTLLIIGTKWYSNIHGILWFIKNVLDNVNIKLQIVGRDMEEYENDFSNHPKIEFLGAIKDISSSINNADYILCPIFKGGGMKVKICEALMYGKNIIATKEAFEGYDIDFNDVGAVCNSKEEFISTIEQLCSLKRAKFNLKSRKYYLEKYSFIATLDKFKEIIG